MHTIAYCISKCILSITFELNEQSLQKSFEHYKEKFAKGGMSGHNKCINVILQFGAKLVI